MASWNEFCADAKRFANRAVKKTEELAHTASLHVKLEGIKNKLSAEFEKLGRLTYKQLKTSESQAEAISEVISAIDSLRAEEKQIKKDIEDSKKKEYAEDEVKEETKAETES